MFLTEKKEKTLGKHMLKINLKKAALTKIKLMPFPASLLASPQAL